MGSPVQLVPTYFGFIESTYDALVLFEACLSGIMTHVPRRPHDREREHIIKSGNIFIYEENSSGIKRWTDGISWSPSRILGNFLIYRQLAQPFGPGEKKKANKKPKGPTGVQKNGQSSQGSRGRNSVGHASSSQASSSRSSLSSRMTPEIERALIGSLVDSYDFLPDGLVKKTISVCLNGITHHLVSYYKMDDAISRKFNVPSRDPKLAGINPRPHLINKQNFRGPVEESDPLERLVYDGSRYSLTNQSFVQQPVPYMTPPEEQSAYQQPTRAYNGDYLASAPVPYDQPSSSFSATPTAFQAQYAPAPGIYPAPQQTEYNNSDQYVNGRYSIGSNSVVSADGSRVQMPAPGEDHRRSSVSTLSTFRGSQDSGLSLHNNETHPSQAHASYYSRPRGDAGIRGIQGNVNAPMTQRALPSLSQSYNFRQISYDRPADATGHYSLESGRDNSWQMAGNSSVGHGHYQQSTHDSAGPHQSAPTGHYHQQPTGSNVAHNSTSAGQTQYQQHWPYQQGNLN